MFYVPFLSPVLWCGFVMLCLMLIKLLSLLLLSFSYLPPELISIQQEKTRRLGAVLLLPPPPVFAYSASFHILLPFPFHLFMFSHSIFHHLFQKKKSKAPKKKRTVAAKSKNNPQKFTFKKSETFSSQKKKSYQATAAGKIGVKVAKK